MSSKTDEELLQIVEEENSEYTADALEAAKRELDARGKPYQEGARAYVPSCFAEKYYAGESRFWVYLIDSFAFSFLGAIFGSFVSGDPDSLEWNLVATLTIFLYYFLMELAFGKTVGKMILGTKVVDKDGNPPSTLALLLRTLCRFIPFDAFSFLLGSGWSKDGRLHGNWHDQLSETYVVSERMIARDKTD